jgi:hypothetical protein
LLSRLVGLSILGGEGGGGGGGGSKTHATIGGGGNGGSEGVYEGLLPSYPDLLQEGLACIFTTPPYVLTRWVEGSCLCMCGHVDVDPVYIPCRLIRSIHPTQVRCVHHLFPSPSLCVSHNRMRARKPLNRPRTPLAPGQQLTYAFRLKLPDRLIPSYNRGACV